MVCFKSRKIYDRAKILRDHGMSPKKDIGMKRLEIIIDLQTFKQLLGVHK